MMRAGAMRRLPRRRIASPRNDAGEWARSGARNDKGVGRGAALAMTRVGVRARLGGWGLRNAFEIEEHGDRRGAAVFFVISPIQSICLRQEFFFVGGAILVDDAEALYESRFPPCILQGGVHPRLREPALV